MSGQVNRRDAQQDRPECEVGKVGEDAVRHMGDQVDHGAQPADALTRSAASVVTLNPWQALRRFTDARIALGRAGVSLPTRPQLAFQLAHAQARDAVHLALDAQALIEALRGLRLELRRGVGRDELCGEVYGEAHDVIRLHSAAPDRHVYLQRPDLGRSLDTASREALQALCLDPHRPRIEPDALNRPDARPFDVAFIVADGLSPLAIARHAVPFLRCMLPLLEGEGVWRIAPLTVVEQSRVALADEVGELLGAKLSVILIGERPGLSSPDSMGLYVTWMPRPGLTDAQRNCISNVRQSGLSYQEAAGKLHGLLGEARRKRMSGVLLKEG
jgi:ethanolamine ammonia-lyase small subunit